MDLKYYIDLYKESGYIIELRKYIGKGRQDSYRTRQS